MKGFWRNPDATAATTTADGFFRTGDMARCDRDGRYYIVDRLKDMILVSGFNVYPNEIEAVTSDLPGVVECACIGVPDGQGCEAVALYIVRRDETLSAEIVMAHCRRNLTAYKVPRHIHFIETMPKSAVGKLLRRELRAISPVATSRKPGASL
jgi:long-chain acyl-CoA synthetase